MSDKLPQQSDSEEVDLGQLFNAIGKLFERFFSFIGSIFKGIFSAIIFSIQPLVKYFKLLVAITIVVAVLGYVLDSFKEPVYMSKMVVKPHFDSKYQLASNIDYFNSLIRTKNLSELSSIFEMDTTKVKHLVGFTLDVGPETQNDLFVEYDEYVQAVDTSLVDELTYIDFIKNRDLLSSRLFEVKAMALKNDIFLGLEEGFRKTFENSFSKYQKKVRDTMAIIKRSILLNQLGRLDSIQKTYLEVKRQESERGRVSVAFGTSLPLQEEKTATKEFEIFQKEQEIGRALTELEQEIAEKNTYFDVLSRFDKIGRKESSLKQRYLIVFPILFIGFFYTFFLILKAFKFIKNYE